LKQQLFTLQSQSREVKQYQYRWTKDSQYLPKPEHMVQFITDLQNKNPKRPVVIQCR